MTQTSNSFMLDGIQFNLHATTTTAFSFHTERDTSASMDIIKSFVETLNGLISMMNGHFKQRSDRNFNPLTDFQKEDMTENEIKRWEDKAREGILNRDNQLGKVVSGMQSLLTQRTEFGSLRDVGITGGTYTPGEPFKLAIDEARLQRALEADPDKVYNIFAQNALGAADRQGGFIDRISAVLTNYETHTKSHTLQTLRDSIDKYGKNMKEQTTKMYMQQEKLYVKFAAFETAMSEMNAQMNSVLSYFG
jgi:flagellar hook-associated protein 2